MLPTLLIALAIATQTPQNGAAPQTFNTTPQTLTVASTYIDPAADIQAKIIELGGGP
jgi:hypothetical protein